MSVFSSAFFSGSDFDSSIAANAPASGSFVGGGDDGPVFFMVFASAKAPSRRLSKAPSVAFSLSISAEVFL